MLFIIIGVALLLIIILKIRQLHLHIDFASFFKKGFVPLTSPHGLVTFTGEQRLW